MILPQKIGNGRTNDEDEESNSRGASLYLEQATDVSYSEDGMEVAFDNSALMIVDPVKEDANQLHNIQKSRNHSHPINRIFPMNAIKRRVGFQQENATSSGFRQSDEPILFNTIRSKPYKLELLRQHIIQNSPGQGRRTAILVCLKEMGVKTYVIDGTHLRTSSELLDNVKRVIKLVANENFNIIQKRQSDVQNGLRPNQHCLLYQDEYGRLFNIIVSCHAVGPVATYQEYLQRFSGLQAMIALTLLCRAFPCMIRETEVMSLRPAVLSLIFGLVMTEESSLSFLNAAMMIRALPSISAHSIINSTANDNIRKAVVLSLAVAGAATGKIRMTLTVFGIAGACMLLLSNLGSRAWRSLGWRPISYHGPGSCVVAYICSIMVGIALPYFGHRNVLVGGKFAMEYVIRTSVWVALVFAISDYDVMQSFLIDGSELCNQQIVNFAVGAWWMTTTIVSLVIVRSKPYYDLLLNLHSDNSKDQSDENAPKYSRYYDGEKLLEDDHASPVGYRVPSLPNFEIDLTLIANYGIPCFSLNFELTFGLFMALVIGAALMYLSFTDFDNNYFREVNTAIEGFLGNQNETTSYGWS